MLVLHHNALNSRERPADDNDGIANYKIWHFRLPHADVLISLCGKLAYAVSEHDDVRELEISKEIAEVLLKIAAETTT